MASGSVAGRRARNQKAAALKKLPSAERFGPSKQDRYHERINNPTFWWGGEMGGHRFLPAPPQWIPFGPPVGGLDGDPRAALKARVFLREWFGGKIRLEPLPDGGLMARWNENVTALLRALGSCGSGGRMCHVRSGLFDSPKRAREVARAAVGPKGRNSGDRVLSTRCCSREAAIGQAKVRSERAAA